MYLIMCQCCQIHCFWHCFPHWVGCIFKREAKPEIPGSLVAMLFTLLLFEGINSVQWQQLPYSREQKQVLFSNTPNSNMSWLLRSSSFFLMWGLYLSQWVNQCSRRIAFNLKIYFIESVISIDILPQIITQYLGGILENNECILLWNIMSIGTFIFLLSG